MIIQVKIETKYDEYQMIDKEWYGEFSDEWAPEAIKVPFDQLSYQLQRDFRGEWVDDPSVPSFNMLYMQYLRRGYDMVHAMKLAEVDRRYARRCAPNRVCYYVPAYNYLGDFAYHSKRGQSKGEIYREAMRHLHADKKRLLDFYAERWWMEVIIVTASVEGIEMGRAACGGIESDGDQVYKQEIINDLVAEATAQTRDKLMLLKSALLDEDWEVEYV